MGDRSAGEFPINNEGDITAVRRTIRDVAASIGFGITDITCIVTATSELARNTFNYAGSGVMKWRVLTDSGVVGIELLFEDKGPGIANVDHAMQEGITTGLGLGIGLPGTKRLMDEMDIESKVGKGTTVTIRKWLPSR